MKQKSTILFFCMIIAGNKGFCQYSPQLPLHGGFTDTLHSLPSLDKYAVSSQLLPSDFSTSHLGFFCKKELKLESVTRIPFRLRLGSVSYCDWLEGKKNSGITPPAH